MYDENNNESRHLQRKKPTIFTDKPVNKSVIFTISILLGTVLMLSSNASFEAFATSTLSLTVSISPPGGPYNSAQAVTLAASSTPSIIFYTTDGTTPTTSSPSGPSPVSLVISTNSTLKFFAKDNLGNTGPTSTAVYTLFIPSSIIQMNDTVSSAGLNVYKNIQIQDEIASRTSQLVGKSIDTIVVDLKKTGLPSGPVQVGIINNDTSVKQLFGTIDASALTTSFKTYSFSLTPVQSYKIQAGDRIGIKFTGGDSSNNVVIMEDSTNAFDGMNSYLTIYDTAWQYHNFRDLYMILSLHLYRTGPTVSISPPGGPYNSAQTVTLAASRTPSIMFYTTDGTTPTTSSPSGPSPVTGIQVSTNSTLKFFAKDNLGNTGPIVTSVYTFVPVMYLNTTEINSTATRLVWNVHSPSSNGTVVSYRIERHQNNNTGTFTNLVTVAGSLNNYVDNTRVSGYPYVYRVTAFENDNPVAVSSPVKITPMLFGLFSPDWTPSVVANMTSHLGKNDFGTNGFSTITTDMFPTGIQKGLLFCSVTNTTQNSTTCLHGSEQQTRVNAVGHGISYLMYDNEEVNNMLNSPTIEIQNPAYYTDKGANDVHGFGYKYGVAPSARDSGSCFTNPVSTCGLLWKELRQVHWANVDLLDLQFEAFAVTSPKFVSDVQNVANWVYSNSSGHTLIMVQVSIYNGNPVTPAQMLPNLHTIKGLINGTNIQCSAVCNTTATETIFRGMMR